MPNIEEQMSDKDPEPLEERKAWEYYYRYMKGPISPLLFSLLSSMLKDTGNKR